jgi:Flp pilus assembly protein TadG
MIGLRRFLADRRGGSAVELALCLPLVVLPLLSAIDLGLYMYSRIQVEFASQAAVGAVQRACQFTNVPVTDDSKCTAAIRGGKALSSVINTAVQSTTLGDKITVDNSCSAGGDCWDIESFYCLDGANKLQALTSGTTAGRISTNGGSSTKASTTQTNCVSVGGSATVKPGDYIAVRTRYDYTAMFPGVSIGSLLAGPIRREALLRIG